METLRCGWKSALELRDGGYPLSDGDIFLLSTRRGRNKAYKGAGE